MKSSPRWPLILLLLASTGCLAISKTGRLVYGNAALAESTWDALSWTAENADELPCVLAAGTCAR